jgi:hypothetical protein
MGALIGFIVGYVLGAKTGPEGWKSLERAWESFTKSEDFDTLVSSAGSVVEKLVAGAQEVVSEGLERLRTGSVDLESWRSVADAEDLEALVSKGIAFLDGVIEQGRAMFSERARETAH